MARHQLGEFIGDFIKSAGDFAETESVRPYRVGDTARRLPGMGSSMAPKVPSYTAPNPPTSSTSDTTGGARAVPPPPV